jgi:hypothetical protein
VRVKQSVRGDGEAVCRKGAVGKGIENTKLCGMKELYMGCCVNNGT